MMRSILLASILAMVFASACNHAPQQPQQQERREKPPDVAAIKAKLQSWNVDDSVNKMDGLREVTVSRTNSDGAAVVIRCSQRKTTAYIVTPDVVDDGGVRVRFDDSPPLRQSWSESTDHTGLFSPDPIPFARRLVKTKTLLFEFHPFQKTPRILEFEISNLDEHLSKIANACNWDAFDRARAREAAALQRAKAEEQALLEKVEQNVHRCKRDRQKWCWSDPQSDSAMFREDSVTAFDTRDRAISDAMTMAKIGVLFHERSK